MQNNQHQTQSGDMTVAELAQHMNGYATKTEGDISNLQSDVSILKKEVKEIKETMVTKTEFNEFKTEMYEFKAEMSDLKHTMDLILVNTTTIKTELAAHQGAHQRYESEFATIKKHIGLAT